MFKIKHPIPWLSDVECKKWAQFRLPYFQKPLIRWPNSVGPSAHTDHLWPILLGGSQVPPLLLLESTFASWVCCTNLLEVCQLRPKHHYNLAEPSKRCMVILYPSLFLYINLSLNQSVSLLYSSHLYSSLLSFNLINMSSYRCICIFDHICMSLFYIILCSIYLYNVCYGFPWHSRTANQVLKGLARLPGKHPVAQKLLATWERPLGPVADRIPG